MSMKYRLYNESTLGSINSNASVKFNSQFTNCKANNKNIIFKFNNVRQLTLFFCQKHLKTNSVHWDPGGTQSRRRINSRFVRICEIYRKGASNIRLHRVAVWIPPSSPQTPLPHKIWKKYFRAGRERRSRKGEGTWAGAGGCNGGTVLLHRPTSPRGFFLFLFRSFCPSPTRQGLIAPSHFFNGSAESFSPYLLDSLLLCCSCRIPISGFPVGRRDSWFQTTAPLVSVPRRFEGSLVKLQISYELSQFLFSHVRFFHFMCVFELLSYS